MLTVNDIRKSYGKTVAVDGLSFEVRPGEVLGLLGPNGAGKSTTISMAVGLLEPDSGSVTISNQGPPTSPAARRFIGLAPQSLALYDEMSADENLVFFAKTYGLSSTQAKSAADRVLDRVGLTERRSDRVKTYSGGMKRRLNFAAALLHEPPLVLLDEPTAGVDPQSRSAILDLVRAVRNEGRAVVYTTHYMEEAQRVCDRIVIVDHGRACAAGTVDDLIATHGGSSQITIRTAEGETTVESTDPVADLAGRLDDKRVLNVRIDRPDLEAVFLRLTGRRLRD